MQTKRGKKAGGGGKGGGGSRSPQPKPVQGRTAREVVCLRLAEQAKRFPNLDIRPLETDHLEPRDAAFAHAVYDAVLRQWLLLEHVLSGFLSRPWKPQDPRAKAALLSGAAQLLLLDRVPDHAVLNDTVEWAKRAIRPGAGGMINAVLRKVAALREMNGDERVKRAQWTNLPDEIPLADGTALVFTAAVFPEDELQRLGITTSHPHALLKAWGRQLRSDQLRAAAHHSLAAAPTVLNVAHAKSDLGKKLVPHSTPGHAVFTGGRGELIELLSQRTDVWVQDAASSGAIASIADLGTKLTLIVDFCAGQGTKTRQLAATFPEARIIATDTDDRRRSTLEETFAGSEQVQVLDPEELREAALGQASLIVLDVPCTNTGVLARRVEAKYRVGKQQLERLAEQQRQIIVDSIPLLGPGGRILYTTCSLEPQENGDQAAWANKWHQFKAEKERQDLPRGRPGDEPTGYADGAYSVLLG